MVLLTQYWYLGLLTYSKSFFFLDYNVRLTLANDSALLTHSRWRDQVAVSVTVWCLCQHVTCLLRAPQPNWGPAGHLCHAMCVIFFVQGCVPNLNQSWIISPAHQQVPTRPFRNWRCLSSAVRTSRYLNAVISADWGTGSLLSAPGHGKPISTVPGTLALFVCSRGQRCICDCWS